MDANLLRPGARNRVIRQKRKLKECLAVRDGALGRCDHEMVDDFIRRHRDAIEAEIVRDRGTPFNDRHTRFMFMGRHS